MKKNMMKLIIIVEKKNIIWFSSAWDLNSLKFLDKYDLKYNKIASAMLSG